MQDSAGEYVNVDARGIPRPPPRRGPPPSAGPGRSQGASLRTNRPRPIYDDRQYQSFLDTGRRESLFSDPAIVDYHSIEVSRHPRGLPDPVVPDEGSGAQASGAAAMSGEGSGDDNDGPDGGKPVLPQSAEVPPPFPLKDVYLEASLPRHMLLPPPFSYPSCGGIDWFKAYTHRQDFFCKEVLENLRE